MDSNVTKVLLLDDDPHMGQILNDILALKGFEPITVTTGAAALARIEQQDIDVVLIDIKLQDMSGLEVLRTIKTRTPNTECIVLTGHATQATAIEAVNLGAYSYFQKPYEVDQLLVAIRRAAEKHAVARTLLESEARFRSMIENSTDLICLLNQDTTIRYINPSIERLLGYSSDMIVEGSAFQDYIHPEDVPLFEKAFRYSIRATDASLFPITLRMRHRKGTWRTLEGTGRNLRERPEIEGVIVTLRDVTERSQSERERQALLEIMQGLAVSKNLQEFLQLIHRSIAKVIYAENFFVVFHNKTSGLFEEVYAVDQYDAAMPPSKHEKSITSYVFRTGEPLLLTQERFEELVAQDEVELVGTNSPSWLGAPLKTPSETIGVIVVQNYEDADCYTERDRDFLASVGVQVSLAIERKQSEDALRSSEASLQAVLHSTADGILAVNSENEVLYTNERFQEMWRIPREVMVTRNDSILLQHVLDQLSDPKGFLNTVQELYSSKEESFDTLDFKDGRVFERLSHPLMQGSSVHGRVWSFRDITNRQQAERDLHRSKQETDHANRLLLALSQGAQAVQRARTTEEAYEAIQNQLTQMGYHTTGFLRSEDGQSLHIVYVNYKNDLIRKAEKATGLSLKNFIFRPRAGSILQRVMSENETVYVEDPAQAVADVLPKNLHSISRVIANLFKLNQSFFSPLKVGEETIGILAVDGADLSAMDTPAIAAFANQVAIAIKNIQLYEQAQQEIIVRKQTEEALAASDAELRALFATMLDVVLVIDRQGKYLKIAPTNPNLLAKPPEELLGKMLKDVFSPEQAVDFTNVIRHVLESNQTTHIEYDLTINNRTTWFEASISPMTENSTLWVARDITERKQTEEKVRASEERYRMLAENMSDTIWLMDLGLRTTYISPSVTRSRGFTLEEINTIPLERQFSPDSLQSALKIFAEMLSPENLSHPERFVPNTIELEFFRKDGTTYWSETTFNLIRNAQGQPFAILASGRDIGERKRSQAALENSEKYFRLLIENNTDAIVLVDPRGMVLYESPAYARMMGRETGQRLGRTSYEHIHPDDRASFSQTLNDLVRHPGEIRQTTFRNQHKDKTWHWIEATITNLLGESTVQGLVINMHDITGRKVAEEEIRRRVADLEVLYENGLSISVLLEPRSIAQKMIEILSQKLEWHLAAIRLINPETKRFEVMALKKYDLDQDENLAEIDHINKIITPANQGLSGWVIKHGKTIRSGDVQADKRYLSTFPEIRSGLYVPLMIGEQSIGSIAVESRQPDRFSADDERLLQTLAAQSAIAIENARLYQEAVRAEKRKSALHQGGLDIVRAGHDIDALCRAVHHAVQQVMPAEFFVVSLITENGLMVEAPYLYDRGIIHPNSLLPVGAGITGRVIKNKKPLLIKDILKSRGVKPIMVGESEPTRSILSVPLLAQAKIIGVISTQSRDPDVFSHEDQIFVETIASEAAVAFESARLFDEIRRRLTELESLSQVSDSLTSVIDLQSLLESILVGARNAIPGAEKGAILLTEPDGSLRIHAVSGYFDPRFMGLVLPSQNGYASRVARERKAIKIDDVHADYDIPFSGAIEEIETVKSGIAAPLIAKGKVIGVISLDNASQRTAFTDSDLRLLVTFASSAAVAIENARLFSETQQRLHRLSALHSIDAAIGASVDIKVTLNIVLEHVLAELNADAAAVLLFNQQNRVLEYTVGSGFRLHVIEGLRLRLGEGLAGQTVLQRRAINIADLRQTDEMEQVIKSSVATSSPNPLQYLEGENFVSYHAIPLIAKGQIQGVLEIFRRTPMQVDQEWITFFEMLAGQTALAIDNGRLFENLQHSNLELTLAYDATIQGWSQALELRDEETEGHTLRVTELTLRLIQVLGVEEAEMEHARRGSLLHDIGKIAIPDSILLKPGPLDEKEWTVMRQHPQYAYNMLSPITYLLPAIHIPWCHHEKWDGSGYPRGLKGEAIPVVARIFAIVDVYDALTSNRPYRLAWKREKAMEYIREQSGLYFDPRVVTAFMDLMAGEKLDNQ